MDDRDFLEEKKKIEKLSEADQKAYYQKWLENHTEKSITRVCMTAGYARILYVEGSFREAMEVLMPVIINHYAYPYCKELITCFNMMGLAVNCEAEYDLARHFFQMALQTAKDHHEISEYAKEYNNIGLTYHDQFDDATAIEQYKQGIKWISDCSIKEIIAPMLHGNLATVLTRQHRWSEALLSYKEALKWVDPNQPEDVDSVTLSMILYDKLGMKEEYDAAKKTFLSYIEKQKVDPYFYYQLLDYEVEPENREFSNLLIQYLKEFLQNHSGGDYWKAKVVFAEMLYKKAKEIGDTASMLEAMEKKACYQEHAIEMLENKRLDALREYIDTSTEKQKALEKAENATRAKSQFLSNMSHDIRTPMNAIFGIAQLMEYDKKDPDKLDDHIKKLKSSSKHLLSLINDVLDMSKIESTQVDLNEEPISLQNQLEQIEGIIGQQAADRKQTFTIQVHELTHENIIGDSVRLNQILINLLSNAVKYTQNGGIITLDLTEKKCAEVTHALYTFSVTDTGCGMTPEFIEHIFEPFTRAENSVTNKVQGTGLGMAITKKIVDMMGGTINVESKLGEGSCFTVSIPFEIDEEEEKLPKIDQNQTVDAVLDGMNFLCAEDNMINAEILEAILEMEGASCTILSDGKQIVEKFREVKPGEYDAILMDMQMPVMNGLEATKEIRRGENPLGKTIPIIAMTANAFSSDVKDCLDAGMDAHLSKPLDIKALKQTIGTILGRGGDIDENDENAVI